MDEGSVAAMISAAMAAHELEVAAEVENLETVITENMETLQNAVMHTNQVLYGVIVFLGVIVGAIIIKYLIDRF